MNQFIVVNGTTPWIVFRSDKSVFSCDERTFLPGYFIYESEELKPIIETFNCEASK